MGEPYAIQSSAKMLGASSTSQVARAQSPGVHSALEIMEGQISTLHNLLDSLNSKLMPLRISPPGGNPAVVPPSSGPESGLTSKLHEYRRGIADANDKLRNLLDNLDI